MAAGQTPDLTAIVSQAIDAGSLIPPGVLYVGLETPLGNVAIDPGQAAQDPTTQSVLQALGIHVTVGLGTAPATFTTGPALASNLKIVGLVIGGILVLMLLRRR